ncbi:hypothetical protein HPB50_018240 [Hyalomma asiaticum]|uniref:Uncharacterized protein n=1 Tax=Hyalomma asiaticum TaxID=266040 RepID=A0ACB7SRV2_HYAAI|nr:hypothetical protein HPB50_018240 [Hyalomma asiaticum]
MSPKQRAAAPCFLSDSVVPYYTSNGYRIEAMKTAMDTPWWSTEIKTLSSATRSGFPVCGIVTMIAGHISTLCDRRRVSRDEPPRLLYQANYRRSSASWSTRPPASRRFRGGSFRNPSPIYGHSLKPPAAVPLPLAHC